MPIFLLLVIGGGIVYGLSRLARRDSDDLLLAPGASDSAAPSKVSTAQLKDVDAFLTVYQYEIESGRRVTSPVARQNYIALMKAAGGQYIGAAQAVAGGLSLPPGLADEARRRRLANPTAFAALVSEFKPIA